MTYGRAGSNPAFGTTNQSRKVHRLLNNPQPKKVCGFFLSSNVPEIPLTSIDKLGTKSGTIELELLYPINYTHFMEALWAS